MTMPTDANSPENGESSCSSGSLGSCGIGSGDGLRLSIDSFRAMDAEKKRSAEIACSLMG